MDEVGSGGDVTFTLPLAVGVHKIKVGKSDEVIFGVTAEHTFIFSCDTHGGFNSVKCEREQ